MTKQDELCEAYRKIGEGFIALSRAMQATTNFTTENSTSELEARKIIATFRCPECKKSMVLRKARATGEMFAGCSKFPDCNGVRSLSGVASRKPNKITSPSPDNDKGEAGSEYCPF